MSSKNVTVDKILRGKISIIQLKKGFRYGFEAVFLASFVNGYLKKIKKKKDHWQMLVLGWAQSV